MKNKLLSLAMLVSLLAFEFTLTSCGPSAAQQAMLALPSVEEVKGLKDKLAWLKTNAKSGESYVLEVTRDENISELFSSPGNLTYKDRSDITITIKGVGGNWGISVGNLGTVFTVGPGVTLILDDNITLHGIKALIGAIGSYNPLVIVAAGGTLIMNEGSSIVGNVNNSSGGGVLVNDGSTFLMKGGTIARNACFPIVASTSRMSENCNGGGVYVSNATFIKTGGTITGYASDTENGNAAFYVPYNNNNHGKYAPGNDQVVPDIGHAVYAVVSKAKDKGKGLLASLPRGSEWTRKSINITIGPNVHLSLKDGVFSGNWDGKDSEIATSSDSNIAEEAVAGETTSETQSE